MVEVQQYSIAELAHYTGIKPHTIRIWEKRYNLFCPKRSCTNIRTYDSGELRKLINVKALIDSGWKISHIGELSDEALAWEVKQLSTGKGNTKTPEFVVNSLMVHMLAFDEVNFSQTLTGAFEEYGVKNGVLNIIYPFLTRIGVLWQVNDISPAQEHFASGIIRRKLITAIDALDEKPLLSKYSFILCLPPDEFHEIPLLLTQYLLKQAGIKTIYLGSTVTAEIASIAALKTNASHLFTIFMSGSPMDRLKDYLLEINRKVPGMKIVFSGCPDVCKKSLLNDSVSHITGIQQFETYIENLLKDQ